MDGKFIIPVNEDGEAILLKTIRSEKWTLPQTDKNGLLEPCRVLLVGLGIICEEFEEKSGYIIATGWKLVQDQERKATDITAISMDSFVKKIENSSIGEIMELSAFEILREYWDIKDLDLR